MNPMLAALEKLQLTTKLLIGFSVGLVIAIAIGSNAIHSMTVMSEKSAAIYEKELLGISRLKEANINLIYMGRSMRQMMLAPDAVERNKARLRLDTATITLQKELDEARKRIFREEAKQLLTKFDALFEQYKRNVARTIQLMEQEDYRASEAVRYLSSQECSDVINTADDTLTAMTKIKEQDAHEQADALAALSEKNRTVILLLVLLGVVGGVLAGFVIGKSIKSPNERLHHAIEGLAEGKLNDAIPNTDYPNEIGAFARAIQVLQGVYRSMETQRWVKTHVADISTQIQQADNYAELATRLLSSACPLLGAGLGVLYLHEDNQLRLLGSYGWRERKHLNQSLKLGEGLFGQSALEKQPITIHNPPEDYVKIGSALGESTPRVVSVLPVIHGGELLAMLELASFQSIGERENTLLDALLPVIAITLEILGKNLAAQQLMKEAQERAEQMEKQAAQLEEASVEMEAQQSELLKTEEWYRRIVQVAEAMLVVDVQGIVILSNPKAEEIFGFESGALVGQHAEGLIPSWQELASADAADAAGELRALRRDGRPILLNAALTRLPDIGIRSACTCLSLQNLTGATTAA